MNTIKGSQTKYWLPFIIYVISNLGLTMLLHFQASAKLVLMDRLIEPLPRLYHSHSTVAGGLLVIS